MLFNSPEFLIFIWIVFLGYWWLHGSLRLQNAFLLVSSYFFYGWWDWRFLGLLVLSSAIDFNVGRALKNSEKLGRRKLLLFVSLAANLGILAYFKYCNFFIQSTGDLLRSLGFQPNFTTLNIILPVGISFYTFQTLGYTIDIYRRKIGACDDWLSFFTYVSFFPQLVAGPIERASNLIPQIVAKRQFDYQQSVDGLKQVLWGLFKKVAIADTCASVVNPIFELDSCSSPQLMIGAVCFAFQIYCDFSGYSDIAIGIAKLLGFRLMTNFRFPYFSRDIAEFWRRWHISLSTWFRDYVYIPLGGSRVSKTRSVFNIFIVFLISGFWHGANWTFLVWGAINALLFVPLFLSDKNRKHIDSIVAERRYFPSLREVMAMAWTFGAVCIGWIFFRAQTVLEAINYIQRMFDPRNMHWTVSRNELLQVALLIAFVSFEWSRRRKEILLDFPSLRVEARWLIYLMIAVAICTLAENKDAFIYFQF